MKPALRKALSALVVLLSACHPAQNTSQVDAAVDKFHERLAAADDDAIYRDAGPEYQRSIDPETNRKFLARIRRKMGTPGVATRTAYATNSPGIVTAEYRVSYANGDVDETFIWRQSDGKTVLLGFTANSPLLTGDGR